MRLLIAATVIALTITGCTGDGDKVPDSRGTATSSVRDNAPSDAGGDKLTSYFASLGAAYSDLESALPEGDDSTDVELRDGFSDFRAKLGQLDPPPDVRDAHNKVSEAMGSLIISLEIRIDGSSETADRQFVEAGIKFFDEYGDACDELVAVAQRNRIEVDFPCRNEP